ncbi:MAG: 3'(2'),5'-bisphosphate nucleotidase CysQ [Ilumatobacteraceae bacterium]
MSDADPFDTWAGLDDAALAAELARVAGERLVEHRITLVERGTTVWQLKDSGDLLAHHFLVEALSVLRPDDAVLSEEGADDRRRLTNDRVWIVDPLDGTQEYGEGRADWAVHVALWERGRLSAGAVSLPSIERVFGTSPPVEIPAPHGGKPRLVTSRTRAPYAAILVAEHLDCEAFRLGSAGAKAMSILLGEADIYVHDGGMYQWDSAAPAAVALAAGLHASRLDGSPLVYNGPDAWLPDFFVCRPEHADGVLEALWGPRP